MNKWLYLLLLALLTLLIGLWSIAWQVGSTNQTQQTKLEEKQDQLEEQNQKLEERDKKIKQLRQKLESKLLKQQLATKATPQASSTPPATLKNPTSREILAMVYREFWPDKRFHDLIMCESGYDNWADGYDAIYNQHNYGIMQVGDVHGFQTQLANPEFNIKIAKQIYLAQGWAAWPTCSKVANLV